MMTSRLASARTIGSSPARTTRLARTSTADCLVAILLFADCAFWFDVLTSVARGAAG